MATPIIHAYPAAIEQRDQAGHLRQTVGREARPGKGLGVAIHRPRPIAQVVL